MGGGLTFIEPGAATLGPYERADNLGGGAGSICSAAPFIQIAGEPVLPSQTPGVGGAAFIGRVPEIIRKSRPQPNLSDQASSYLSERGSVEAAEVTFVHSSELAND